MSVLHFELQDLSLPALCPASDIVPAWNLGIHHSAPPDHLLATRLHTTVCQSDNPSL